MARVSNSSGIPTGPGGFSNIPPQWSSGSSYIFSAGTTVPTDGMITTDSQGNTWRYEAKLGQWVPLSNPNIKVPGVPETSDGQESDPSEGDKEMLRSQEVAREDGGSIRATLFRQLLLLEELNEGMEDAHADAMNDALFFLRETIEALNKVVPNSG